MDEAQYKAARREFRVLMQRDKARDAGDRLARSVRRHTSGHLVDLVEALAAYDNDDGPTWAGRGLDPDRPWIVSEWSEQHERMMVVADFADRADADALAARLRRGMVPRDRPMERVQVVHRMR